MAKLGLNADLPFEEGILGDRQVNGYESQQLQRDARPYPGRAELRPAVAGVEAGHRVVAASTNLSNRLTPGCHSSRRRIRSGFLRLNTAKLTPAISSNEPTKSQPRHQSRRPAKANGSRKVSARKMAWSASFQLGVCADIEQPAFPFIYRTTLVVA